MSEEVKLKPCPNAGGRARCGTYGVQRCYVPTEAAVIAAQQRQRLK